MGNITLNELITKGINALDTPLIKLIKDPVVIHEVGAGVSTMLMYKAVMKIYMKSAYPAGLPQLVLSGTSTRSAEIALFMLMGAPAILGALYTMNQVSSGGSKVILSLAGNTELEGISSGININSSSPGGVVLSFYF